MNCQTVCHLSTKKRAIFFKDILYVNTHQTYCPPVLFSITKAHRYDLRRSARHNMVITGSTIAIWIYSPRNCYYIYMLHQNITLLLNGISSHSNESLEFSIISLTIRVQAFCCSSLNDSEENFHLWTSVHPFDLPARSQNDMTVLQKEPPNIVLFCHYPYALIVNGRVRHPTTFTLGIITWFLIATAITKSGLRAENKQIVGRPP